MTRPKKLLLIGVIFGLLVLAAFGASVAARFYLGGSEQRSIAAVCGDRRGTKHVVTISNNRLSRMDISARLCDELVIINSDPTQRRLAFGEHDHHVSYDGADGRLLGGGESLTLVLAETGWFSFHDHFDDDITGHFTVR